MRSKRSYAERGLFAWGRILNKLHHSCLAPCLRNRLAASPRILQVWPDRRKSCIVSSCLRVARLLPPSPPSPPLPKFAKLLLQAARQEQQLSRIWGEGGRGGGAAANSQSPRPAHQLEVTDASAGLGVAYSQSQRKLSGGARGCSNAASGPKQIEAKRPACPQQPNLYLEPKWLQ